MGRNWTHPTWHNRRVARTKVITCFNVRLSRETGESRRRVFWPTTQRKRDCRRRRRRRRRVVGVNDLCNGVVNSRRPNVVATVTVVEVPLGVQFLAAVPIVRPRIRFHYGRGGNSLVQLQAQTRRKCPSKPSAPMIQLNSYECFP